jgi:phospholipase/carboxylesterase
MSNSYIYRERKGAAANSPLLLLLHGTGGDEDQFFDLGGQLLAGARLIAPRGDVSERGALRYFKRTGEGAYDMADLQRGTDKLAGFVAEQIGDERPSAVIGLGYSNGANILASTIFAHPELFDAAVLLHPLIPFVPSDAAGLAGKRVLITAGRRDPISPVPLTERLAQYFERQGSDVSLVWHDGGHDLAQSELAAVAAFVAPYATVQA